MDRRIGRRSRDLGFPGGADHGAVEFCASVFAAAGNSVLGGGKRGNDGAAPQVFC